MHSPAIASRSVYGNVLCAACGVAWPSEWVDDFSVTEMALSACSRTDGAKLQLVSQVLQSTDKEPQTASDFQLIPWHVQHAQAVRAARSAATSSGPAWRSSQPGPIAPQPKSQARPSCNLTGEIAGLKPLNRRGLKDPDPIMTPDECDHPRTRSCLEQTSTRHGRSVCSVVGG